MSEKVDNFLAAAQAEPDMARQVSEAYGEASALLATRLSELSKKTSHFFAPEEFLTRALSDAELEGASGGARFANFPVKLPAAPGGVSKVDYHYDSSGPGRGNAPGGPGGIFKDLFK